MLKRVKVGLLLKITATMCLAGSMLFGSFPALAQTDSYEYIPAQQDAASFVSKDMDTGVISYFDLYVNNTRVSATDDTSAARTSAAYRSVDPFIPDEVSLSRSIIGTDDRIRITTTTTFPFCAIGVLNITFPNGATGTGTGWLFYDNVVITAGHCVFDSNNGGWATAITFIPGANGSTSPYGSATSTQLVTSTAWANNRDTNHDWGVITLNSNIGRSTGYFGITWQSASLKDTVVHVIGYPGEYFRQMWGMGGTITRDTTNRVFYTIDTTGGQSGSPVYKPDNYVVAIHTTGSATENGGTRITKALFDYFASLRV